MFDFPTDAIEFKSNWRLLARGDDASPRTEWYYSNERPLHRWSVQTDFVWAIPFKANSVDATEKCCAERETGGPPACQD